MVEMQKESGKVVWRQLFRKENLIVLILAGVLLFVISLPVEKSGKDEKEQGTLNQEKQSDLLPAKEQTAEEYAIYLEDKLRSALSKVADVGQVEVMITLKSSAELVIEKEEPIVRSVTDEKDSQGGSREVVEMDSQENTVYRTDGSVSEPYVIKTLVPKVEGVLVVAQGAGTGTVSRSIVEIVQALFGVEAHKVQVVKMNP